MHTLALLDGLLSPLHITILLAIVVAPVVVIAAVIVWNVSRRNGRR